jgi:hypothetical protein
MYVLSVQQLLLRLLLVHWPGTTAGCGQRLLLAGALGQALGAGTFCLLLPAAAQAVNTLVCCQLNEQDQWTSTAGLLVPEL